MVFEVDEVIGSDVQIRNIVGDHVLRIAFAFAGMLQVRAEAS